MIFLFAIGWTIFAVSFVRHTNQRRPRWAVIVLAASFLGRNVLVFIFVLVFAQYGLTADYAVQLVYLTTYGLLSVAIWTSIVVVAGCREENAPSTGASFTPLHQSAEDDRYGSPSCSYAYVAKSA